MAQAEESPASEYQSCSFSLQRHGRAGKECWLVTVVLNEKRRKKNKSEVRYFISLFPHSHYLRPFGKDDNSSASYWYFLKQWILQKETKNWICLQIKKILNMLLFLDFIILSYDH